MKKFTKLITLLIAVVLSCTTFIGCGGGGGGGKGSLSITVYDAGFGYAWVENMALAFEEETGKSAFYESYIFYERARAFYLF